MASSTMRRWVIGVQIVAGLLVIAAVVGLAVDRALKRDVEALALRQPPAWLRVVAVPAGGAAGDGPGAVSSDSTAAAAVEDPRLTQAMAEYMAARYALALVTLEDYLGEHPSDGHAQFYAGVAALAVGSESRARHHLTAAAAFEERRGAAQFYLAQAHLLGGRRDAACAALREVQDGVSPYALRAAEQLERAEALRSGVRRLLPGR